MKLRSGAAIPAAESVEKSGMSMIVFGKVGETVDTAEIRTGFAIPCFFAYSIEQSTRAAPPSLVAQISKSRSGAATSGDASTSASV